MKTIIAIDPGASGGIAMASPTGESMSFSMPQTEGEILEILKETQYNSSKEGYTCVCYMENLVKYVGGGAQTGAGMAVYASNWGLLKGIVITLGWKLVLVTPQRWQKHLGLGTRGPTTKTQWKNKLKSRAEQLFPTEKVTLKTADALLIMEYAIHMEK